MGDYKVNAKLMINDMIWWQWRWWWWWWCFFSMLETRKRFWELRTAWVCKLLITRELFCCAADFWRHPRLPGRSDKKQTFRKHLRTRGTYHVEKLSAIPLNIQFPENYEDDSWASKQENYFFLKNNVWLNIFNKKKVCNKFDTKDCNKFDKVILRNSWRHIMVPGNIVRVDV